MTTTAEQEQLFDDAAIWRKARSEGIVLVPLSDNGGSLTSAAIGADLLDAVLVKLHLDPDSWQDVYSLGLGFFVDHSAPGTGTDRAASYRDALKTYEDLNMRDRNAKQLALLNTPNP